MKHEQLLTDVFKAYYDARKHKRNTTSQLKFEVNMEDNLVKLAHDIESRQYEVERSICFIVTKPVKREVFAADFRDRVVHHLLYNYLSPLLERTFIHDCYSCRKGFGTLYGINRVAGNIRKCTQNFTRPAYVLKLDISGYFMSMNRKILLNKLVQILDKYARRRCGKEQLRWSEYLDYDLIKYLLEKVVLSNPTDGCIIRGNRKGYDTSSSPYVFPILRAGATMAETARRYRSALSYHNRLLKRIGCMAGLARPLTTYVARHSWASAAYKDGVNINVIAQALGHSSPETTRIYVRELDGSQVFRANKNVLNGVKKQPLCKRRNLSRKRFEISRLLDCYLEKRRIQSIKIT
jgi:hypothetical protein